MPETNCTKICSKCKKVKPFSAFNKRAVSKDGRRADCKDCKKKVDSKYANTDKVKSYQAAYHVDYQKTDRSKRYQAAYRKTDTGKLIGARHSAKYRANNPIKIKAVMAANKEISSGRVIRPDHCEECPSTIKIEGHHDDYSLLLVVRWLCRTCHNAWHAENGAGLNG